MNKKIQYFFNEIDNAVYNNPPELAKQYLTFILENSNDALKNSTNSIYITKDDNDLSYITKRCFLISDGLTLSCKSRKSIRFNVDYSTENDGYSTGYYSFNNNLNKLGIWIQQSRSLLIDGKLSYYPNTYAYTYDDKGYMSMKNVKTLTDLTNVSDSMISSHKLTTISSDCNNINFEPVLALDIPIIDSIDLESFCNISLDNAESLNNFQTFLKHRLLSIDTITQSEIEKLSLELKLQLNDIKSNYKNTIYKYHMNTLIGGISTVTALLFLIAPDISSLIQGAIGVSSTCGLLSFLKSSANYFIEKNSLKNKNCYFLWVIGQ